jgi:hypothetical protein
LAEDGFDESFRSPCSIVAAAKLEDYYFVVAVVGSRVSPCAGTTTDTTSIVRSSATWNCAKFFRLVAPIRAYSAWPVGGCAISTAAATSTYGTYGCTQ